jgi:hypothetical protein
MLSIITSSVVLRDPQNLRCLIKVKDVKLLKLDFHSQVAILEIKLELWMSTIVRLDVKTLEWICNSLKVLYSKLKKKWDEVNLFIQNSKLDK